MELQANMYILVIKINIKMNTKKILGQFKQHNRNTPCSVGQLKIYYFQMSKCKGTFENQIEFS